MLAHAKSPQTRIRPPPPPDSSPRPSTKRADSVEKHQTRKEKVSSADAVLVVVATAAITLTIFSEQGLGVQSGSGDAPLGIVAAIAALVLAALVTSVQIVVGEQKRLHKAVVERLKNKKMPDASSEINSQEHEVWLKLYLTGTAQAIPKLVVGIVMVGYGFLETLNGTPAVPFSVVLVGAGMGVLYAFAVTLFWAGNHLSRSDTINSLYYGVPVLALGLLWAFTDVQVGNVTMFLIGMTGVVAANMALHLDPRRYRTKAWTHQRACIGARVQSANGGPVGIWSSSDSARRSATRVDASVGNA